MTTKATKTDIAADNAPEGVALTEAEKTAALKEGAIEDVKQSGKDAHRALTDGSLPGEPAKRQWHGHDEIQQWADTLDLGVEAFEDRIADKSEAGIPEEKIYGLLALERNGKNRTPYVKVMMKRLKLKADELPGGGPGYTNDVTNITDL